MIPRAKLTNEIFGNPLKVRVTACRKRIRDRRTVQRTHAREVNPAERESQQMAQFPADSAAVRQSVGLDLSPAFDDKQAQLTAESAGEQEVGIT
jgi:hypothetical protein